MGARRRCRRDGAVPPGAHGRDHRRFRDLVHRGSTAVGPVRRPAVFPRLPDCRTPLLLRPPAVAPADAPLQAAAAAAVSTKHRLFEPAPVPWWKPLGELLLVTAGCTAFIALATWPQVVQPYAVSDPGDPLFSVWRLMWVTHEFVAQPAQHLQRQPVLSRAPHAHLLGPGSDAGAAVRAAPRAGPASGRGRLQHRVPVGRVVLRGQPCTTWPGR